jgi:hypothetical protein
MPRDYVAIGTRAWQAEASKAGRAQSTPGLFAFASTLAWIATLTASTITPSPG